MSLFPIADEYWPEVTDCPTAEENEWWRNIWLAYCAGLRKLHPDIFPTSLDWHQKPRGELIAGTDDNDNRRMIDVAKADKYAPAGLAEDSAVVADALVEILSGADGRADVTKKNRKSFPKNPEVVQLWKRLQEELPRGRSRNEIAASFAESCSKRPDSLLRKIREHREALTEAFGPLPE